MWSLRYHNSFEVEGGYSGKVRYYFNVSNVTEIDAWGVQRHDEHVTSQEKASPASMRETLVKRHVAAWGHGLATCTVTLGRLSLQVVSLTPGVCFLDHSRTSEMMAMTWLLRRIHRSHRSLVFDHHHQRACGRAILSDKQQSRCGFIWRCRGFQVLAHRGWACLRPGA